MAADKKKIAADCWRKGTQAMNQKNWDYAIDMFTRAVALVPENVTYRQTLRGCERMKYDNNKSGARMAGMRLMGVRTRIKKSRLQKDWDNLDRTAEEGLKLNPWDAQLNADVGEACQARYFTDCAVFAYETAIENDPNNTSYLKNLGLLLENRNNFDYAIQCWSKVQKLEPLNTEARQKIADLVSRKTIEHGGYEDADNTQSVRSGGSAYDDYRPAKDVRAEQDEGPGTDPVKDLERAIRKEPKNVNNYLKLAELQKKAKQFADALETFDRAVEVSNSDPNVCEQRDDCEILLLRHEADQARSAVRENPDDEELRQKSGSLASKLVKREIEVLSEKVKRYPKEARLKFELAQRLIRVKRSAQAIPLLQQAATSPSLELDATVSLGECFLREKKEELALRQFKRIVSKLDLHDQPDTFKRCHYLLGTIYENKGDVEAAEEHYNEVLGADYEYRDVLQRLERLGEAAE